MSAYEQQEFEEILDASDPDTRWSALLKLKEMESQERFAMKIADMVGPQMSHMIIRPISLDHKVLELPGSWKTAQEKKVVLVCSRRLDSQQSELTNQIVARVGPQ